MKTQRRIGLLVVCLVVCFNALASSQEPNEPVSALTFGIAPMGNEHNMLALADPVFYGRYAVKMRVNDCKFFSPSSRQNSRYRRLISYLKDSDDLTQEQRYRIQNGNLGFWKTFEETEQVYVVWLQAMTEEDAKTLSQLYLNHAIQNYNKEMNQLASAVESRAGEIVSSEKTISKLEQELPKANKEFEGLKAEVLYRSSQEAEQAIQELNRILTIAQVDIAGIRSAIETIQDFQTQRLKTRIEVIRTLEPLLVEHTVSLKAAQARESTARRVRTQAIRYIELGEYTREGPRRLREAKNAMNADERGLTGLKEEIARQIKPEVIDNKVTLYKLSKSQEN
ncbi:MAG: hypothetical protein GY809_19745 [Planctomycetes bacterium]|nr:hypothetical protein [Planctomycetota bacterium]